MEEGLKEAGFKYYQDYSPCRWMKETEYGMIAVTFCEGYMTVVKHFKDGFDSERILREKI